eukprot:3837735-Pleurochrysis_carterae.AAC.3
MLERTSTVGSVEVCATSQSRPALALPDVARRGQYVVRPRGKQRAVTLVAPGWSRARRSQERAIQQGVRPPRSEPAGCGHCGHVPSASVHRRTSSSGRAALRCCPSRRGLCLRSSRTVRLQMQRELASGRPSRRAAVRSALGRCLSARRLEAGARLDRNGRTVLGKGPSGRSPAQSCARRLRMSQARLR